MTRTVGWTCPECLTVWNPEVRRCEQCTPEPDRSGEALEQELAKAVFMPQIQTFDDLMKAPIEPSPFRPAPPIYSCGTNVPVTNHSAEPERAEADFGGYIGLARQRMRQAAEKVADEDGA